MADRLEELRARLVRTKEFADTFKEMFGSPSDEAEEEVAFYRDVISTIEALRRREEGLRDENAKLRGWCAGMIDGLQHILEITESDVEHDREIHYHTHGTLTGEQGEVIPASFRELIGVDAAALAAKGDGK